MVVLRCERFHLDAELAYTRPSTRVTMNPSVTVDKGALAVSPWLISSLCALLLQKEVIVTGTLTYSPELQHFGATTLNS